MPSTTEACAAATAVGGLTASHPLPRHLHIPPQTHPSSQQTSRSIRGLPQAAAPCASARCPHISHRKRMIRPETTHSSRKPVCPTKNPCVTPLPFFQNRESLQQPTKPPPITELCHPSTTLSQPSSPFCMPAACRKRLRLALTRSSVPPLTTVSHISTAVLYPNFMHPVSHCITVLHHLHRSPVSQLLAPCIALHHGPVSSSSQSCIPTSCTLYRTASRSCIIFIAVLYPNFMHPVSHCITVLYHLHRRPPQYTCILWRYHISTLPLHTPLSPISLQTLCQPV